MATVRGMDGSLHVGGVIFTVAQPVTDGAVSSGANAVTVVAGMLRGIIMGGDTFTVTVPSGAADNTLYTVDALSGGRIAGDTIDLTFTPGASRAWPDGTEVDFAVHEVAQVRSWSAAVSRERLDASFMGLTSKAYRLGQLDWTGNMEVLLDYESSEQGGLIDKLLANVDTSVTATFRAESGKQFYGDIFVSGGDVTNEISSLVSMSLEFQGTSLLEIDWS